MIAFTRKTMAATVADRWRKQYYNSHNRTWTPTRLGDSSEVYETLVALGPDPATDSVAAILPGWVVPWWCDECDSDDGRPTVKLGAEPDYESRTANICEACLRKALALIEGAK